MDSRLICGCLLAIAGIGSLGQFLGSPWSGTKLESRSPAMTVFTAVMSLASIWAILISDIVPAPYMDEIFHIPQAQVYCQGRVFEWDPMITTPPGLYLVPLVVSQVTSHFTQSPLRRALCDVDALRLQNFVALCLLFWVALSCRRKIERLHQHAPPGTKVSDQSLHYSIHTAMNICLFPMLLFFSGLYYTDVMSTLLVLVAFDNTLNRLSKEKSSFLGDLWTIFLGTATLLMRQTNIFWVVVFMGGLEAVHSLKMLRPTTENGEATKHWIGDLVDQPLDLVNPLGFLEVILGIGIAAICNPFQVLRQIWPHISIMGLFAGFVAWNGGVVLGDKSNHVATIHISQMLYIWPMAALFSWPLWTPAIIEVIKGFVRAFNNLTTPARSNTTSARIPPWAYLVLRLASGCGLAAVIIHFNTIVHPFTLADNRHYMFYVFRYTIRRSYILRMALAPIYVLSAWLCWTCLVPGADFIGDRRPAKPSKTRSASSPEAACKPTTPATILLLLVATTLSLITAPLVEPRYFIIPWVLWRLYCPAWYPEEYKYTTPCARLADVPVLRWFFTLGAGHMDVRAAMETASLLVLNVLTMAMFLYKPFLWKGEDGTVLEGGNWQRFIW